MKRRPKKQKSILLRLFVLLLCGYFAVSLASLWSELNDSLNELEELKQQQLLEENEIKEWDELWCEDHDGRMTIDMGECRNAKGYHNIKTFIGSSDYDTSQMSRLLDLIIDDCRENGIQVITDRERSLLIDEWGNSNEQQ